VKLTLRRIKKLLGQFKICRIEASELAAALRGPTFSLSAGTVEAASDHILILLPHLQLLYQHRWALASAPIFCSMNSAPLRNRKLPPTCKCSYPLPGVGRIVAAMLLAEASHLIEQRDCHAPSIRKLGQLSLSLPRLGSHSESAPTLQKNT